jgi:hypothetical protein
MARHRAPGILGFVRNSDSTGPDQVAALRAALRHGVLRLLVLAVGASVIAGLMQGMPGVWGALLGAAVGGGFVLFTAVVVLATANAEPTTLAGILLGSWLLKLVLAIIVMVVLRGMDFYSRGTFVAVIALAVVGLLTVETRAVLRTNVAYVDPLPSGPIQQ